MPNALLPPFSSIPIPAYMRREFRRRAGTYGLNPSLESTDNIQNYRGQSTPWIRTSSNGKNEQHSGFIMKSATGFADSYGIGKNTNYPKLIDRDNTVLGIDYKGNPHIIKNTSADVLQKYRPTLGIESVEVDIRKNVYRAAFIKWKCFSVEQLNYMTPFFMTPYTTIFLEWGWNNFNNQSLVPVGELGSPAEFLKNGEIKKPGSGMMGFYTNPTLFENSLEMSEGRYDGMVGHIINYDYTFNPSEMCFNCTTEIASNSRFYFGLASSDLTNEPNKTDPKSTTQKTKANFLSVDLYSVMMSYLRRLRDNGTIISSNRIDSNLNPIDKGIFDILEGRLFSPNLYKRQETHESATNNPEEPLYITLGCLVDLLNYNNNFGATPLKINIKDTFVSAHPNMISWKETFLIPNAFAPYFCPESLSDPQSPPRMPRALKDELPIFSNHLNNSPADRLMDSVLFNTRRQDLNKIINHWRITYNPQKESDYQFPSAENQYRGKIENVYISFNFIRDQLKSTPDIKDFLKVICQCLNDMIPIWNLELIDWDGNLSIRDNNYFDMEQLDSLKSSFKIDGNVEKTIYEFDAFSQNSIFQEFGFGVKLSDAVANMVINQVNNQLSHPTEGTGVVVNQRLTFPESKDMLLSALPKEPPSSNTTVRTTVTEVDAQLRRDAIDRTSPVMQNITEKSITFTKTLDGGKKLVSRLIMPGDSGKAKVFQLLNDESEQFSSYNTPPIPGVKIEFSLLGIAGFRTFQVIGIKNLPHPYDNGKVVFQITEIKHSVNSGGWKTSVTAVIRPLKSLNATLST